jgi:hypothetical protein
MTNYDTVSQGGGMLFFICPPSPLARKESCEKIESSMMNASFVAWGGGKFTAPKPGGRCKALKHFPDFRKATPAIYETFSK